MCEYRYTHLGPAYDNVAVIQQDLQSLVASRYSRSSKILIQSLLWQWIFIFQPVTLNALKLFVALNYQFGV